MSQVPLRTTYFQLWADFGELPHVLTDFFYVPVILVFRRDVIQGGVLYIAAFGDLLPIQCFHHLLLGPSS